MGSLSAIDTLVLVGIHFKSEIDDDVLMGTVGLRNTPFVLALAASPSACWLEGRNIQPVTNQKGS